MTDNEIKLEIIKRVPLLIAVHGAQNVGCVYYEKNHGEYWFDDDHSETNPDDDLYEYKVPYDSEGNFCQKVRLWVDETDVYEDYISYWNKLANFPYLTRNGLRWKHIELIPDQPKKSTAELIAEVKDPIAQELFKMCLEGEE